MQNREFPLTSVSSGAVRRLIIAAWRLWPGEEDDEIRCLLERFASLEGINLLLGLLDDRRCRVVILRFGLAGGASLTLKETGRRLSITGSRAQQLQIGALQRLPLRAARHDARMQLHAARTESELLEVPVEALDLPVAAIGSLKRGGIYTFGDLAGRSGSDLFDIRNLGAGRLRQIREALAEEGLMLRPES